MDKYYDEILEAYFEEADKDDNETKVEVFKNGKEEPLEEGVLKKMKDYGKAKTREQQEELVRRFKEAQDEYKYKYWCVRMLVTSYNYSPAYSDFYLYGSNERPFSRKDTGWFRTWKKSMNAKKIAHYKATYILKIQDVPPYIRQYIL
jgi:hypothetical protein